MWNQSTGCDLFRISQVRYPGYDTVTIKEMNINSDDWGTYREVGTVYGIIELNAYFGPAIKVTIHELGHAIGLDEHSSNPNDIMYPESENTQPSDSEIQLVRALNSGRCHGETR